MLCQRQSPRQLAFHRGKRPFDDFTAAFDLIDGMRRFELHPIRASIGFIETQTLQHLRHTAIHGISRIALRHDYEVLVDLVFRVHRGPVARHRFVA